MNMKYILIDDDPIINLVHKKVIINADTHAEVIVFSSGKTALNYFKTNTQSEFAIVLLDINMPEMNGFEFLEELIKNKKIDWTQLNIFILTSSLNVKDREEAKKYPMLKGYLGKPLNINNLLELTH
jgi:CheY-like chemotaxis protein